MYISCVVILSPVEDRRELVDSETFNVIHAFTFAVQCSPAGSAMQSSSTLNSDDTHLSPSNTLNEVRGSSTNTLKPHKRKETFLSRLTQQFSRVVRPHKEIEWPIKRSKLNKIVYEQTDKYLTCPYRMELDGGLGNSNPKLTLYVHPYGKEEDINRSVTLEVGIEMSSRPKTQRLDSRAEVEVRVRAEDKERKAEFGSRVARESIRSNYFFVRGFISHQDLKQSHSETVVIIISANLISTV